MAGVLNHNQLHGELGPLLDAGETLKKEKAELVELAEEDEEPTPEVDIVITNVVSNFATRCHLNLRQIANNAANVIYKREQAMVLMRLRNPKCTANIWSSGKITVTGSQSEDAAKKSSRRIARILQKLGFRVRFCNFRIVNVLGIVNLPFGIKIAQFTENHPRLCSYEPEIHPGATYKWKDVKATYKIFQTGAITITAPNVASIEAAVHHIYPLVQPFHKEKPNDPNLAHMKAAEKKRREALGEGDDKENGSGVKRKRKPLKGSRKKRRRGSGETDEDDDLGNSDEDGDEEAAAFTSEEEAEFTSDDDD